MTRRELILYATPTGELADACRRYFTAAAALGPTTAQTYPPHCSLTGFFHRSPANAAHVISELQTVITDAGAVPAGAVRIGPPTARDGWVGLSLESVWLADLTARVVALHRLRPGDDPLRPKSWLHLSLAYGFGRPEDRPTPGIAAYADLAHQLIDPSMPAGWEVAVWERTGPTGTDWLQH